MRTLRSLLLWGVLARLAMPVVCGLLSCGALSCGSLWAQLPTIETAFERGIVPDIPAKTVGFECLVEMTHSMRPGYVAVNFTFDLPVPATAERTVVVRVQPRDPAVLPMRNSLTTELPLVIQQGASHFTVQRYFPKWTLGNSFTVEFFESERSLAGYSLVFGNNAIIHDAWDGVLEHELSSQWLVVERLAGQPNSATSSAKSTATTSSTQPALTEIRTWLTEQPIGSVSTNNMPSTFQSYQRWGQHGQTYHVGALVGINENELPTDWRGLQMFDVVVMDSELFEQLATSHTAEYEALTQWLLLGGSVVLRGMDPQHKLPDWLGRRAPTATEVKNNQQRVVSAISNYASRSLFLRPAMDLIPNAGDADRIKVLAQKQVESASLARTMMTLSFEPNYVELVEELFSCREALEQQQVGMGRVVGWRSDFPETPIRWNVVERLLDVSNTPSLRRGVDPQFGDSRFRRWMIPGVAQPPVYSFMGLLTLFVILVGPVSYRYTTRRGRGYLMFAIAPILAGLTTVSMFAYGIVADGFGMVARVRQVTWIDGASGDCVTRVRGTYFAGIRPANGLRFDADAEVMWYPDSPGLSATEVAQLQTPPLGTVTIDAREQRFSSSLLPSRQQRQFVVHQALPQFGAVRAQRIQVQPPGENTVPQVSLEVTNDLALDLSPLVVCDEEGDFWSVESIAAQATLTIQTRLLPSDRSKLLGDLYNSQRLLEENSGVMRALRRSRSADLLMALNRLDNSGVREETDGVLEQWLREHLQLGSSLEPGMYVALASIDPRFVAAEGAEVVDSIHFVIGTMPKEAP